MYEYVIPEGAYIRMSVIVAIPCPPTVPTYFPKCRLGSLNVFNVQYNYPLLTVIATVSSRLAVVRISL